MMKISSILRTNVCIAVRVTVVMIIFATQTGDAKYLCYITHLQRHAEIHTLSSLESVRFQTKAHLL